MKFRVILPMIILLLFLCGCTQQSEAPNIAASTLPVYEFTQRICEGTGLTVSQLITESVSCLHDYSLHVNQMRVIEGADVVVLSGAGLEEFMGDALQQANDIIDASAGIHLLCGTHSHDIQAHDHEHAHENDPHIWLSPANAMEMSRNICIGLEKRYPDHKNAFQENLALLLDDLSQLQAYGDSTLAELNCRSIITFHDGFAYLAQEYGITILEAVEEESGSEVAASELIRLIELVNQHQISAIFTEKNGSTAAASIISGETGTKCFELDMGLSGEGYFDAMYHNFDRLREALQ